MSGTMELSCLNTAIPSFPEQKPLVVFDAIFGGCPENAVIALGSRRPNKDGEVVPHFLIPVYVEERHTLLPGIFEYLVDQSQYLCPNGFKEQILLKKTSEEYMQALKNFNPLYFPVKNEYVSHLCALFVDLDVGRENDIPAGLALGIALDATMRGILPFPSFGRFRDGELISYGF